MTTAAFDRPGAFRIGKVFGDSFAVLGRNLPLAIGLALLLSGVPTLLFQLFFGVAATPEAFEDPNFLMTSMYVGIAGAVLSIILSSVLQAALIRAAIEDMNGKKPTFGDCLSTAFAVLLPAIGIAILVTIGAGLGAILLLVPGIMLWLRWSVAVPVQVQERLGVLGSMARSAVLTNGSKWALFGLFVILVIVLIVIQLALASLFAMSTGWLGIIVQTLVSSLATMIMSIAIAVSYVELRLVKEGTSVTDLAKIFA